MSTALADVRTKKLSDKLCEFRQKAAIKISSQYIIKNRVYVVIKKIGKSS